VRDAHRHGGADQGLAGLRHPDARYLQITAVDAHDESHVMSLYEFQVLGTQIPMLGPRIAVQSTAASSSCGVQSCVKSSVVGKFDVRTTFTSKGAMQTGSGNMYIDFMLPRAHDLMSVGIFVNSAFLRDEPCQVFLYSAAGSSYRKFTKLTDVKVKMDAGWQFFDVLANPDMRLVHARRRLRARRAGSRPPSSASPLSAAPAPCPSRAPHHCAPGVPVG
jgi:hypothetical protein